MLENPSAPDAKTKKPQPLRGRQARHKLMLKAPFSGMPVAKVGRTVSMDFTDPNQFQIAAANLAPPRRCSC